MKRCPLCDEGQWGQVYIIHFCLLLTPTPQSREATAETPVVGHLAVATTLDRPRGRGCCDTRFEAVEGQQAEATPSDAGSQ